MFLPTQGTSSFAWATITGNSHVCCKLFPAQSCRKITLSNRWRACSLRTRPHKRVTMIMVGLFTTKVTIKVTHFRRGAHSNGGNTCFGNDSCQKTAASWMQGRNSHLSPFLGGALIGWVLGCSLKRENPSHQSKRARRCPIQRLTNLSIPIALPFGAFLMICFRNSAGAVGHSTPKHQALSSLTWWHGHQDYQVLLMVRA